MSEPAYSHNPPSIEDYLELEKASAIRHERVEGQLFAMVGGTDLHNLIVFGLRKALDKRMTPRGCWAFSETMKLRIGNNFRYPDVLVTCSERDNNPLYKTDPLLLAEVLSEGSWREDRKIKSAEYRKLPSLNAYLLLYQTDLKVQVYLPGQWEHPSTYLAGQQIELPELDLVLSVDEIYADVKTELS